MLPLLLLLLGGASVPDPIEDAALGLRLADHARRTDDAEEMLMAARIVATSGVRPAAISGERLVASGRPALALALAAEARAMAPGDARIAAAAEALGRLRPKGAVGGSWGSGPLQLTRTLPSGGRMRWMLEARAAELAVVSAIGDGDADLGLAVADGAGRTVCRNLADRYYPLCRWRPARAGLYRVELMNGGRVPTEVTILSN